MLLPTLTLSHDGLDAVDDLLQCQMVGADLHGIRGGNQRADSPCRIFVVPSLLGGEDLL